MHSGLSRLRSTFDWSAAQRAFLDALRAAVENLPDGERERVYQDFETRTSSLMSLGNWRSGHSFRRTPRSCWQSRVWTTAKPGAWLP